jgi:hypothetical protein
MRVNARFVVAQADHLSAAYSVNKRKLDQLDIVLLLAQVIDHQTTENKLDSVAPYL